MGIGHTDRFACAVVAAPVTNLQSHFGTSDSGYYVTSYAIGGEIWEARDVAQRLSPINYAHLVTTPTLILQGEDDERCPVGQSEELFATMMRAGNTPVELVVYPGEHHGIAEAGTPSTRGDYFTRLVEWVVRWCEADESVRATTRTTDTRDDARSDQRRVTAPEPVAR